MKGAKKEWKKKTKNRKGKRQKFLDIREWMARETRFRAPFVCVFVCVTVRMLDTTLFNYSPIYSPKFSLSIERKEPNQFSLMLLKY